MTISTMLLEAAGFAELAVTDGAIHCGDVELDLGQGIVTGKGGP